MSYNKKNLPCNRQSKPTEEEIELKAIAKEKGNLKRKLKNIKRKALKEASKPQPCKETARMNILQSLFPERYGIA